MLKLIGLIHIFLNYQQHNAQKYRKGIAVIEVLKGMILSKLPKIKHEKNIISTAYE
jgi:hypothetical protein